MHHVPRLVPNRIPSRTVFSGIQLISQQYILIVRVKFRSFGGIGHLSVKRQPNAPGFREKLTQFQAGCQIIPHDIFPVPLLYFLVEGTKTDGTEVTGKGKIAKVRQLQIHSRNTRHTPALVQAGQSKFIYPNLCAVGSPIRIIRVADTDHRDLNITQVGIALYFMVAGQAIRPQVNQLNVFIGRTISLAIALQLEVNPIVQRHVNFILGFPHFPLVLGRIRTIIGHEFRIRHDQRDFVLVIVVLKITSHPHKKAQCPVRNFDTIKGFCVYKHFQPFIDPKIEVNILKHGLIFSVAKVLHPSRQRLFVLQGIEHPQSLFALYAFRQNVIKGATTAVFLDVHGIHVKYRRHLTLVKPDSDARQILGVSSPLVAHQFETSKSKRDRSLELCHIHPHKPDGTEIADTPYALLIGSIERNPETVPDPLPVFAFLHIRDEGRVFHIYGSGINRIEANGNFVFKIRLGFVEGVVAVEVFRIGDVRTCLSDRIALIGAGVTLRVVEKAIAFPHSCFCGEGLVVEVFKVVVGGVLRNFGGSRYVKGGDFVNVRLKFQAFPFIVETIQTHILIVTGILPVVKSTGDLLGNRNHRPGSRVHPSFGIGGAGQTIFKKFARISQDILRNVAQVDVDLALFAGSVFCRRHRIRFVQERRQHPEFQKFNISRLEIIGIQSSHHPSPAGTRIFEGQSRISYEFHSARIAGIPIGQLKVVRTAGRRIIKQIQGLYVGQLVGGKLYIGENLLLRHQTGIRVLFVGRTIARTRIQAVPIEQSAISARFEAVHQSSLGKLRVVVAPVVLGDRSQEPLVGRLAQVKTTRTPLEIVNIHHPSPILAILVDRPRVSGFQNGRLCRNRDTRLLLGINKRNRIHDFGQPGRLFIHIQIQSVNAVVDRIFPYRHLLGKGSLKQMQVSSPQVKIVVEAIICPHPYHRLGLKPEKGIVFKRNIHRNPGTDIHIIEDPYPANIVVHLVILPLHQGFSACGYPHRPLGNIECPQRNFRRHRGFVTAPDRKPVFLGKLPGQEDRSVVQFLIDIFFPKAVILNLSPQGRPKRFEHRKHNPPISGIDRHAFYVVKHPVGLGIALYVENIQVEHPQQRLTRKVGLRQKPLFPFSGIVIKNIEFEILAVDLKRPDRIHVFHHQIPGRNIRLLGRTF